MSEPKKLPILFTKPMVNAIRAGRKTQTRRAITQLRGRGKGKVTEFGPSDTKGYDYHFRDRRWLWNDVLTDWVLDRLPYKANQQLYVRETQRVVDTRHWAEDGRARAIRVRYEADGTVSGWIDYPARLKGQPVIGKCLAYGGFRESARLFLEVTAVRLEPLQSIDPQDAISEGVLELPQDLIYKWFPEYAKAKLATPAGARPPLGPGPVERFAALWDSINKKRGYAWNTNPTVGVYTFKRVPAPKGGAA